MQASDKISSIPSSTFSLSASRTGLPYNFSYITIPNIKRHTRMKRKYSKKQLETLYNDVERGIKNLWVLPFWRSLRQKDQRRVEKCKLQYKPCRIFSQFQDLSKWCPSHPPTQGQWCTTWLIFLPHKHTKCEIKSSIQLHFTQECIFQPWSSSISTTTIINFFFFKKRIKSLKTQKQKKPEASITETKSWIEYKQGY